MNYLLECPVACNRLYTIHCQNDLRGYFILNIIGGHCRIVDVFINTEDRAAWREAIALAVDAALTFPLVCEVAVAASVAWFETVLLELGFRFQQAKPIFLYDPENRCGSLPPLMIQMVDSDAFFLYDPSYPFLT